MGGKTAEISSRGAQADFPTFACGEGKVHFSLRAPAKLNHNGPPPDGTCIYPFLTALVLQPSFPISNRTQRLLLSDPYIPGSTPRSRKHAQPPERLILCRAP